MKTIWIIEYEYEGNWCWPFAEIGWAFPSRRRALDESVKHRARGFKVRLRKFSEESMDTIQRYGRSQKFRAPPNQCL